MGSTTRRRRALAFLLTLVTLVAGTACDPKLTVATPSTPVGVCPLNQAGRDCYASHAGVPGLTEAQIVADLTELTHVVGDQTILVDGTVIDKVWLDGCVNIAANNVTIKNSLIRTSSWCKGPLSNRSPAAVSSGADYTGLVIQDSEIDAGNTTSDYLGVGPYNFTLTRVNVHGGTQPVWAGRNSSVNESYVHDPTTSAAPNHTEAINMDSASYVNVSNSWVSSKNTPQASSQTAGIAINNSYGQPTNLIVNDNFIEGANGTDITFGGTNNVGEEGCSPLGSTYTSPWDWTCRKPWGNAKNTWFVGNHLSPFCYPFPQYGWVASHAGMVWSGNVQSESNVPV